MTFPAWMDDAPAAELAALSLTQAAERLRAKQVSSVELTQACLHRIAALDSTIRAFITVTADTALAQARVSDEQIARGDYRSPLHGIPIALKDLIDTAGVRTTAASRLFADRVPDSDAPIVTQLREAGAVILGKTNLHEFAYGGSGMISAYGVVRNPRDPSRVAGGSSSGSAAAVAAGLCYAAIGTDTAGSIRLPASCCGVIGFKPTHGLVSAEGVIPLAETYDHVGPITRTIDDAVVLMRVLVANIGEAAAPAKPRVGVGRQYFFEGLEAEVATVIEKALKRIRGNAASMCDIELAIEEDRTAQAYESYRYHAEHVHATPDLYDPQTLARILRGKEISPQQYDAALIRTMQMRSEAVRLFEQADVIVTPTVPILPPVISELQTSPETLRPRELLMLRNTRPFNVLGLPTVSVPCGVTSQGLPVGMQFTTASGKDMLTLRYAALLLA